MFDKLDFITEKYDELAQKVSDPEIINNQPVWQKHVKEMGEMEPIVKKYKEYKKAKSDLAEAKEMLEEGDEEMRELAKMEISELEDTDQAAGSGAEDACFCRRILTMKRTLSLEIRAGTGGEEAALFGADLLRMYTRYAERNHWKTELMEAQRYGPWRHQGSGHFSSRERAHIPDSSMRAEPTEYSECRRPSPAAGSIPRQRRWPCCRKWTTWKSI